MAKAGFEVYEDNAGQWRWRLRARNGRLLASSGQGFASRANVERSVKDVRKATAKAKAKPKVIESQPAG